MLKARIEGNINPFCSIAVTGLKGQVVKQSTTDNVIAIAASGQGCGLLAQNVVDFTAAYRPGYRDLSTTDANVNDVVGFYKDGGTYETNIFVGTVTAGDELVANASGYLQKMAVAVATDVKIARVVDGGVADGAGDANTTFIVIDLMV